MKQFEDRLAKYVTGTLFGEYARIEVGAELLPDVFRADVLLIPENTLPEVEGAGLFSRLNGSARCLLEPFSGKVNPDRFEANLAKLRLALYRRHRDGLGTKYPEGVLWLITTYFPKTAVEQVFAEEGQYLEPGLLMWKGFSRETVYLVHTDELELRDDTVMFFLFGKEKNRKGAILKIFEENMEPYVKLLNEFDMRLRQMAETNQLNQLDPEELKNLVDLRDTREEVLRELGEKEGERKGKEAGKEEARREIALKMLEIGEPPEKVSQLTGLSLKELQDLV